MQSAAPIDLASFERILSECFPNACDTISEDGQAVIERMYEDFVLFDLRRAVQVEMEELRPLPHDTEAQGTIWAGIHPATCKGGETHIAFARIFSTEHLPVLAVLYWTGDRLALAIPEVGNLINPGTRAAFGMDGTDARALSALLEARGIARISDHYDYAEALQKLQAAGRLTAYDFPAAAGRIEADFALQIKPIPASTAG